jgi:hypothetical protein
MTEVADIAGVTGSSVGGVAEEETALERLFLRSDSGLSMKFSGRSKPGIHYLVFIHNKRKQAELAYINNSYHICILS